MKIRARIEIDIDKMVKIPRYYQISRKRPYVTEESLDQLLSCLEKLIIWDRLRYFYTNYKPGYYAPLKDREMLWKKIIKQIKKPGSFILYTSNSDHDPRSSVYVYYGHHSLVVSFIISPEDYRGLEKEIVPNLMEIMLAIAETTPFIEKINGMDICFTGDFPFRKIRPPHEYVHWGPHTIVEIIDHRYIMEHRKMDWGRVRHALRHVPDIVAIEDRGPFTILNWIDDLSDQAKIAERLMARNAWIHNHLNLEIQYGFNKYGDQKKYNLSYYQQCAYGIPTYYDFYEDENNARVYYGYQVMVVMPDGSTDEVLLQQLASCLKTKTLPDGNPIHILSLMVQDRDAALLILERAKSLGFSRVLYMDDNNDFWDVDPPGLWLN